MANRLVGEVKWFSNVKGFGFIYQIFDPGIINMSTEYFVHYSSINISGYKTLRAKQRVTFELKNDEKGKQAVDVKPV